MMKSKNSTQGDQQKPRLNPFANREVLKYFSSISDWCGYIRFLGIDQLIDSPDLPIEALFVEPSLGSVPQSPSPTAPTRTSKLRDVLKQGSKLVVLGDPGSGKSTLVNWIAHRLTFKENVASFPSINGMMPLVLVLRELGLTTSVDWESIISAFLDHPMASSLSKIILDQYLEHGQALLLFDGVDEIASIQVRRALKAAIYDGLGRYPDCTWIITSRAVGYEEVPFDQLRRSHESELADTGEDAVVDQVFETYHIMPFDDKQISEFVKNWYFVREHRTQAITSSADDFLTAIRSAPDTMTLARVPNLLTMMAIIHRNRAVLPHGKARLYEAITEAYLGTIDAFKKINRFERFTYEEKRKWLSHIGFRMQERRRTRDGTILAKRYQLSRWLRSAISDTYPAEASAIASEFVEFTVRRSGLLLPRSERDFSFVHLSFMEFFAAAYLKQHVTSLSWALGRDCSPSEEDIRKFAESPLWTEVFFFLFQLLEQDCEWADKLWLAVGGNAYQSYQHETLRSLLIKVACNKYTGISLRTRQSAFAFAWSGDERQEMRAPLWGGDGRLMLDSPFKEAALSSLVEALQGGKVESVSIHGITDEELAVVCRHNVKSLWIPNAGCGNFRPLKRLKNIEDLFVPMTPSVDLAVIKRLVTLRRLYIWDCGLQNLDIGELTMLTYLAAGRNPLRDASQLRKCVGLRTLSLHNTSLRDCRGFDELRALSDLDLSRSSISDISALGELPNLVNLVIIGSMVTDIKCLKNPRLQRLDVRGCELKDWSPLASLVELRHIVVDPSKVARVRKVLSGQGRPDIAVSSTYAGLDFE